MKYIYKVKTVVFDKTGTLTHGKPVVTKAQIYGKNKQNWAGVNFNKFLALVGAAESGSEHPIGMAITNYTKEVWIDKTLIFIKSITLLN